MFLYNWILFVIQVLAIILGVSASLLYRISWISFGDQWRRKFSAFLITLTFNLVVDGAASLIQSYWGLHWQSAALFVLLGGYLLCCILIAPILIRLFVFILNFTINPKELGKIFPVLAILGALGFAMLYSRIEFIPLMLSLVLFIVTVTAVSVIARKEYTDMIQSESRELFPFFYITLSVLPLEFVEYFFRLFLLKSDPFPMKVLITPLYLCVISIIAIYMIFRLFGKGGVGEKEDIKVLLKEKYSLTEREAEVGELIMKGLSHKDIAVALFISKRTVDRHVENIYHKGKFKNKTSFISTILPQIG